MNPNTILITRPDHGHVTNYLFYWSKEIIESAFKESAYNPSNFTNFTHSHCIKFTTFSQY